MLFNSGSQVNHPGQTGVVLLSGRKAAKGFSWTFNMVPKGQPITHLERIYLQFTGLISYVWERCLKCFTYSFVQLSIWCYASANKHKQEDVSYHENKKQFSHHKIEKSLNYILQSLIENKVIVFFIFDMKYIGRTCHILENQRQYVSLTSHDNETSVLWSNAIC